MSRRRNRRPREWNKVAAELFEGIDKALALYEKGGAKGAILVVQDSYFDLFEGSGMEAKLGARGSRR